MSSTINKQMISVDWRLILLLGVSVALLTGGPLVRHLNLTETRNIYGKIPLGWADMDLQWESKGQFGQGIYAYGGREVRYSQANMAERGAVTGGLEEPRLAVFIHRPLDLNRIDFETLRVLKGIGPKMAAAIISYRKKHGSFRRIEDLMAVKGIGPARFKVLRGSLAVEPSSIS